MKALTFYPLSPFHRSVPGPSNWAELTHIVVLPLHECHNSVSFLNVFDGLVAAGMGLLALKLMFNKLSLAFAADTSNRFSNSDSDSLPLNSFVFLLD